MSAAQVTLAGRRAAEALMVDKVTITRVTGTTLDDTTTLEAPTTTTVYTGKARFQSFEPFEQTPGIPGGTATVQRNRLSIPVGQGPVVAGDKVTVTSAALDASLVGRTYRVASVLAKTHATAQRIALDEGL